MSVIRLLRRLLGTHGQRELARAEGLLDRITAAGRPLAALTRDDLAARCVAVRDRARQGEPEATWLVETLALAREVAARDLGLRPFDVQLLGALALHRGHIAEMKTGEGKTLVAALAVTVAALPGHGVHVVTVNDYLAVRDAGWMGPVYRAFGLTVGVVTESLDPQTHLAERQAAYQADVTYVTNHELVFDYLRDNLARREGELLLRPLHQAVVDEVDFLLLDEARTPLIISGPMGDDPSRCVRAREVVAPLVLGEDFRVDHKNRQVSPTESGWRRVEAALEIENLSDPEHLPWQHVVHNALLAHGVYQRDEDYLVEDGRVVLVDEFTGRVSPDKRFADGLHQALEAKEGVEIKAEDRTLAKTSYQNYFRLYPRLAGMTGTAWSAREELQRTYGLRVVRVPTNRPVIRRDLRAVVYRSAEEKFAAVADAIAAARAAGRPVLVGTTSVRESELLSAVLSTRGLTHVVLNAKNDELEAEIIAQAGRPGAVTVSTNMAGRGVDILLGGAPAPGEVEDPAAAERRARDRAAVVAAGGLLVIGTGQHDARRIDEQLRGRAGRQGDPGSSIYLISLDDPIYRQFGEMIRGSKVLRELKARLRDHPAGAPVTDRRVVRTLEVLRQKVEEENQGLRREVQQYDLVVELQRRVIFAWRRRLLLADPEAAETLLREAVAEVGADLVYRHLGADPFADDEVLAGLLREAEVRLGIDLPADALARPELRGAASLGARVQQAVDAAVAAVAAALGRDDFRALGRELLFAAVEDLWTEHLTELERLDEAIGLRGYAQLDPIVEYRREASLLFQDLLREIRLEATGALCRLQRDRPPGGLPQGPLSAGAPRPERRTMKR
jgi:preprotein translocase subunit SecA